MTTPNEHLASALADRYRLERELGAGGMATVYLAHDVRHDRKVAIKVLKPELAQSLTGERFLREIAITARLNHPHILALLDSGASADGTLLYYVMPVASGESVQERLAREGVLPIDEAQRVAMDVTEALVHAHVHGIVHRDIKPANVLLSAGHAIVADFGIAKAIGQARDAEPLTSEGMSLGTPSYMAPEQATGNESVDHRADIYAVGAMLFEMLSGQPPFAGGLQQVVMEKLTKDAPLLADRAPTVPAGLVQLVARCLARDPTARPQTAEALLGELRALSAPQAATTRSRLPLVAAGLAIGTVVVLSLLFVRDRRARWVHETALPEVTRLYEDGKLDSAFALAEMVEERAPGDATLAARWPDLAHVHEFTSEPSGAMVARAPVADTTAWVEIGTTPTPPVRIPKNGWLYRFTLPGHRPATVLGALLGGIVVPIPTPVLLQRDTDPDSGMVLLRGGNLGSLLYGPAQSFELSDFLMDKLEVTHREYKAFVDAGGYTNPTWWDSTIVVGGKRVGFADAMARFIDQAGRPGPSTWEGGAPPAGTEDLPVGGVSWYEARAYARFVHKELPTLVEWVAAAVPQAAMWMAPYGRFESSGPVRGGTSASASARGVLDMAGNVREWTVNASDSGSRYILGGGWSDPRYLFAAAYAQPAMDRSAINGIRLVRRLHEAPDLAAASAPIPDVPRDYSNARPVDDATFRGFLSIYEYDRTPLNATVASRDSTDDDWIREDITFPLAGESEPMWAALFLPKRGKPPYQTVVIWPGSDTFSSPDRQHLSMVFVDFVARSGRAVLYPIYLGTHRRGGRRREILAPTIASREQALGWIREMRRSIDYAVTRPEIDSTHLGFVGVSWGGRMAGVALAVEPRIKAAVLNVAGLSPKEVRPEVDPVNFLPRIRIPVLMMSGRNDNTFPLDTSGMPFHRLLGSPPGQKKLWLWEGGHYLPRNMLVAETLKWFDQHLGPVTR